MKKTMAFVLGSFLAVAAAACGSKQPQETTPPPMEDVDAGMEGEAMPPPEGEQGNLGNPCGGDVQPVAGNPCGK